MTSIFIEEKKSSPDWMVEEYGNTFLESYDSFSSSKLISDPNHNEHEDLSQVSLIDQLSAEEREKADDKLQSMVVIN